MFAATLLPLIVLATSSFAEPVHVPFHRRTTNAEAANVFDPHRFVATVERLRGLYGSGASSLKKRSGQTASISTFNIEASYLAEVSVGTPPQTFNVTLDTGSSDLWFAGAGCTGCGPSVSTFDSTRSSSLQPIGQGASTDIPYGSGEISGNVVQDTVSMGGLSLNSQTFVVATNVTESVVMNGTSGIMGLAFPAISQTNSTPFWLGLIQDGQLSSPLMGLWITRFDPSRRADGAQPGGVFTLGGTDSSLYSGNIEFHDLVNVTTTINGQTISKLAWWGVELATLTVNGKTVDVGTGNAAYSIIDSGTTHIGGPADAVKAFYSNIPNSQQYSDPQIPTEGLYIFPCSTNISASIGFGGTNWPIDPQDMNIGSIPGTDPTNPMCAGGIFDASSIFSGTNAIKPSWIVGDTFLKNVYSVYRSDPPSVGFAQLSAAAGGSASTSSAASVKLSLGFYALCSGLLVVMGHLLI